MESLTSVDNRGYQPGNSLQDEFIVKKLCILNYILASSINQNHLYAIRQTQN